MRHDSVAAFSAHGFRCMSYAQPDLEPPEECRAGGLTRPEQKRTQNSVFRRPPAFNLPTTYRAEAYLRSSSILLGHSRTTRSALTVAIQKHGQAKQAPSQRGPKNQMRILRLHGNVWPEFGEAAACKGEAWSSHILLCSRLQVDYKKERKVQESFGQCTWQ